MKHILLVAALCLGLPSIAQKSKEKEKEKEKQKEVSKIVYKDATVETDDYKIYIIDAVANVKEAKFKIKVFNKTNDYLLIKPIEFKYMCGAKVLLGKDKTYSVAPNEEESVVIDFRGADMLAEKYTVELKGIYKASATGKAHNVPNFELPATKNDFTINNMTCSLTKSTLSTDKSVLKFDCSYVGDGVELINPNKITAIMPNGQNNPNAKKNKQMVLEKGDRGNFTLLFNKMPDDGDMQKKSWQLKWNDTFKESKLIQLGNSKIELVKDDAQK